MKKTYCDICNSEVPRAMNFGGTMDALNHEMELKGSTYGLRIQTTVKRGTAPECDVCHKCLLTMISDLLETREEEYNEPTDN